MKINGKFLTAQKLGNKIAEKMCLGWEVTTVLYDRLGNGMLLFEHNEYCSVPVEFTEINTNDIVTIEFNKLGTVKRNYWGEY